MWFVKLFKVRPTSTDTHKLLKDKIADSFGKKGMRMWKTTKAGAPISKAGPISVSVNDCTDITVLQDRSVVCLAATMSSLNWLSRSVSLELARGGARVANALEPDEIDNIQATISQPFDVDTLEDLKNHGIVWWESKRVLKSSAGTTKVKINLKNELSGATINSSHM